MIPLHASSTPMSPLCVSSTVPCCTVTMPQAFRISVATAAPIFMNESVTGISTRPNQGTAESGKSVTKAKCRTYAQPPNR